MQLLALMFVSLLVLALSFPVDRVVTSIFGQIVTVEPTVVMQPLDLSIIRTIDVRRGERVKASQLLATLDPTFAASDVTSLELQITSLKAEIARCEAELAQKPFVYEPGRGPGAVRYAALQHAYYEQRKSQYDWQIKSYDAQIAQARATINELTKDAASYAHRAALAQRIQDMRSSLIKTNADSELNLLLAADQTTEMQRNEQADQNNIAVQQQLVESTTATKNAFIKQWFGQTSQELLNARNQLDTAEQSLDKALKHRDLVRLTAPGDAIVLNVAQLSVGSILQPGQDFIDLAMLRSPVEVEIDIDPRDIGFVRVGDHVTLKLDSYEFVEYGTVEGVVRWISPGTFTAPQQGTGGPTVAAGTAPASGGDGASTTAAPVGSTMTGISQLSSPFYVARVAITKSNLKGVPKNFSLLPGMTLEADIHVGTHSAFWYVFSGVTETAEDAMREP